MRILQSVEQLGQSAGSQLPAAVVESIVRYGA